jgi:hypothetical protein
LTVSGYLAWRPDLNLPNRRMRTRMSGGVGGAQRGHTRCPLSRSPRDLYGLAEQGDRAAHTDLVITAEDRQKRVAAVAEIRAESQARLASVPALAGHLHEQGVSVADYTRLVEERGTQSEAPLVVLDARGTPSAAPSR